MLGEFNALLTGFAAERGFEVEAGPAAGMFIVQVEGYPLNVLYFEDRDMVMFNGIVGSPPDDEDGKKAYFIRLLTMNHAFSGTGGACLGYEPNQNVTTFQLAWPFAGIGRETFEAVFINALKLASNLAEALFLTEAEAAELSALDSSAPDEKASGGIRA